VAELLVIPELVGLGLPEHRLRRRQVDHMPREDVAAELVRQRDRIFRPLAVVPGDLVDHRPLPSL
jgi:hypothetical protein